MHLEGWPSLEPLELEKLARMVRIAPDSTCWFGGGCVRVSVVVRVGVKHRV